MDATSISEISTRWAANWAWKIICSSGCTKRGAPGGTAFDAPRYEHFQRYFDNVFKEVYTFSYSEDGKSYTVTIEGSPADDDAKVIVRIEDEEYSTTAGKIDELPVKYQDAAKEALKKARRTAKSRKYELNIT